MCIDAVEAIKIILPKHCHSGIDRIRTIYLHAFAVAIEVSRILLSLIDGECPGDIESTPYYIVSCPPLYAVYGVHPFRSSASSRLMPSNFSFLVTPSNSSCHTVESQGRLSSLNSTRLDMRLATWTVPSSRDPRVTSESEYGLLRLKLKDDLGISSSLYPINRFIQSYERSESCFYFKLDCTINTSPGIVKLPTHGLATFRL